MPVIGLRELVLDHQDAVVCQVRAEQVIAELKSGPLAHAPSGSFTANAACLTLGCIAFNILRAAGAATSTRHATARWATLRTHLVAVSATARTRTNDATRASSDAKELHLETSRTRLLTSEGCR